MSEDSQNKVPNRRSFFDYLSGEGLSFALAIFVICGLLFVFGSFGVWDLGFDIWSGPQKARAFVGPEPGQEPGTGGGLLDVDSQRNIGFGTASATPGTAPTKEGWGYVFTVASTSVPGIGLEHTNANGGYYWFASDDNRLGLWDESNSRFDLYINSSGHVGIGNGSDRATSTLTVFSDGNDTSDELFVAGKAHANSFNGVGTNLTSIDPQNFISGSSFASGNYAVDGALKVGTSSVINPPTDGLTVSGNVGIGTSSPNSLLHLEGSAPVQKVSYTDTGGTSGYDIREGTEPKGALLVRGSTYSTAKRQNNTELLSYDGDIALDSSSANVGIEDWDPDANLEISANGNTGGDIFNLSSNDSKDGDLMTVEQGGNVGIGTTTPQSAVHITSGQLNMGGSDITNLSTPESSDEAATKGYVDSTVSGGGSSGDFSTLSVSGTSTLAETSGSVGIGTTNPSAQLDVNGTTRTNGIISDGDLEMRDNNIIGGQGMDITQVSEINDSGGSLHLQHVDTNSRVEVGADSGTVPLDMNSNKIVNLATPTNSSDAATKSYVDSTAGGGVPSGSDGQTLYNSSGDWVASNNLYISSSTGRVGIGVTEPLEQLDVNSGGLNRIAEFASNDSGGYVAFSDGNTNNANYVQIGAVGNDMVLKSGSSERVRIESGGNVGIGDTSPSAKLDVNGSTYANTYYDKNNTSYYLNPSGSSNLGET
ncbi:MAG: hypothetical protein ABEI53_02300, partial [Candidatus Magasanikbacteria bacterium]